MFSIRKHFLTGSVLVVVALSAKFASAQQQSGLQVTPDGKRTLISKDVGDERWAITLNADDGSITGNVFHRDGSAPQFIWCRRTGTSGETLLFSCMGADACPTESCSPAVWSPLQEVAVPQSFFLPRSNEVAATQHALAFAANAATDRASGLQTTPDEGRRTLINKDVGAERWAITRHASDHSVTGNVFSDSSAPPTFLWCEEKEGTPGAVRLACFAAPPCTAAPCPPEQWTFVTEVTIPPSFFGEQTCSDVSGNWRYSERGSLHCTSPYADIDDSLPFGGSGNATIEQNGCAVTVTVSGDGASWTMRGAVTGDAISVSGPADIVLERDDIQLPPDVSIGGTWSWDGLVDREDFELESSGSITASYGGRRILSCSVEGTHEFRR